MTTDGRLLSDQPRFTLTGLGTTSNPIRDTRRHHIYEWGGIPTTDVSSIGQEQDIYRAEIYSAVDIMLCDTCYLEYERTNTSYALDPLSTATERRPHCCQEVEADLASRGIDLPCDCPCATRTKDLLRRNLGPDCIIAGHKHKMGRCNVHRYGEQHWVCIERNPESSCERRERASQ